MAFPTPPAGSSRRKPPRRVPQHQLDVPEAQAERKVQPDSVADDFGREAVTMVRINSAFHPTTMPHANASRHLIKLT
jgi:hypothetical protein